MNAVATDTEKWISPGIASKISGRYSSHQIRRIVDRILRDPESIYLKRVSRRHVEQRARYEVTETFAELLKGGNL